MTSPFNKRNFFNLSHENKLTCKMGQLIPVYCEPVLPGDTFNVHTDFMVRLQALLSPIYHRVNVYTHAFFVPNRIIFDDWEKFITKGEDGNDNTVYPTISAPAGGWSEGSLADYLYGVPTGVANIEVDALPFRAYAKIYNEWYRNQNLQNELTVSTAAGADSTTSTTLMYRNWVSDYYTRSLPFIQRGPQVTVPLGSTAPVVGTSPFVVSTSGGTMTNVNMYISPNTLGTGTAYNVAVNNGQTVTGAENIRYASGLEVDLSNASSATISDWRVAFQIQRLLEKNARGGARYVEWLMSHFGVRSSDARLQRPEYLGGGKANLIINEIVSTANTSTLPQGNMAGHGVSAGRSHSFTKSFEEHGYIIILMSIMPMTSYQQGINRHWSKRTPYDWYLPVLSHLSEQGLLNKEVYAQGSTVVDAQGNVVDDKVFGYVPRYDEYRHHYSSVHGQFRTTLNYWHMGRIFANLPTLSSQFVTSDPTDRVFAVNNQDTCLVDIYHSIKAVRPIPKQGIPGLIDHD